VTLFPGHDSPKYPLLSGWFSAHLPPQDDNAVGMRSPWIQNTTLKRKQLSRMYAYVTSGACGFLCNAMQQLTIRFIDQSTDIAWPPREMAQQAGTDYALSPDTECIIITWSDSPDFGFVGISLEHFFTRLNEYLKMAGSPSEGKRCTSATVVRTGNFVRRQAPL
jgi:hypothetical protein